MWIAGPWRDSFWFLSGLPIAALLIFVLPPGAFLFALPLQDAHLVSPIALGWSHRGLRGMMLARPWKYVALPVAIVVAGGLIGWIFGPSSGVRWSFISPGFEGAYWRSPLVWLAILYALWNPWHFAMQDFGVLSIYRAKVKSGRRLVDLWFCYLMQIVPAALFLSHLAGEETAKDICLCLGLAAAVVMLSIESALTPRIALILTNAAGICLIAWSPLWYLGIWQLNHWLAAVGLSGAIWGRHIKRRSGLFVAALVGVGTTLLWLFSLGFVGIGLRLGCFFWHSLQDRWDYGRLGRARSGWL